MNEASLTLIKLISQNVSLDHKVGISKRFSKILQNRLQQTF